jgi:hypothetical protein
MALSCGLCPTSWEPGRKGRPQRDRYRRLKSLAGLDGHALSWLVPDRESATAKVDWRRPFAKSRLEGAEMQHRHTNRRRKAGVKGVQRQDEDGDRVSGGGAAVLVERDASSLSGRADWPSRWASEESARA